MTKKIREYNEAMEILKNYTGNNPYILMLKKDVYINKNSNAIGDFQVEYILKNQNFQPKPINKVTKITKWYGENRKEAWNTDFIPQKLLICSLLGETNSTYNCYVQYRQSVQPVMCFIPKKAILNNFLVSDFNLLNVDFERYDRLSSAKDKNRTLREHQKDAIKFLLSRKKCILADEMGMGKSTSMSVAAIEGNFDSVLIICPASLKTNWKKELLWYVDEKYISIVDGFNDKNKSELEAFLGYAVGKSNKTKEELLEEAKNAGKWQNNRFVIVNYDILDEFFEFSRARTEEAKQKMIENSPILKYIYNRKSCIIVDEAHLLSNNKSTRYKVIDGLIKKGNPDSVYLATGTPVTNNPQNLYYLLKLIENEVTADYEYYVNTYCNAQKFPAKGEKEKWTNIFLNNKGKSSWYDLTWQEKDELKEYIRSHARMITVATGAENLEELRDKISHIYLRRTKDDLKLPEKHIKEIFYNLTPEQREEYNKLWDEYVKAQEDKDIDKELNKELLEGGIYRRYLSTLMVPNTIKLCNEIIKYGNKCVIACCYDEELYKLQEYYGDACVIYNGKMNLKQKDEAIKKFTEERNCLVFIGNIKAAGVGITLIKSHDLIFSDFEWTYAANSQMQDRIHRIGQTKECNIYYQIFKNTQYEHMWDVVLKKQTITETLIKHEKEKK